MKKKPALLGLLSALALTAFLVFDTTNDRGRDDSASRDAVVVPDEREEPANVEPEPATTADEGPAPAGEPSAAPEGGSLRVVVVEENGAPIAGADVSVTLSIKGVGHAGPHGETDAAGVFVFRGAYTAQVIAAGARVGRFRRSRQVRGGVTELTIAMPEGIEVRGTLRHVVKGPVKGAIVNLMRRRNDGRDFADGTTDGAGRFVIPNVPPGEWDVKLYSQTLAYHETKQGKWTVEPPEPFERDIVIGRLSLTGVVRDARTGAHLADAEVQAQQPKFASTKTDKSGKFEIRSLPAGEYSILVRVPGYAHRWFKDVAVSEQGTVHVVFDIEPAFVLAVKLVDEQDRPLPGEHYIRIRREVGGFTSNRIADANGVLRVDMAEGKCAVSAWNWARKAAAVEVDIRPGLNEARLVMKPTGRTGGTLKGAVRDAAGRPVAGARVRLRAGHSCDAYTDAGGRYELREIPPGAWPGTVERDGFLRAQTGRVEVDGGKTATLDFRVEPAQALHLRVLDPEGQPFRGEIWLFSFRKGEDSYNWTIRTDDDGRATCKSVPAGKQRLKVLVPKRAEKNLEIEILPGANTLAVRLEPLGR